MSSGSGNDDVIPPSYPYYWSPSSDLTIHEFVKKYKPSMVQNDGTKPWLWVRNSNDDTSEGDREDAVKKAKEILAEATKKVTEINEDDSIPVRASKKTGAKSKKQLKDEIAAEYSQKLKEVHETYDYKSGKWLVFSGADTVDVTWSRLAVSVAMGPLSKTSVHLAKVATTPTNESSAQRVICIYMPDVLDQQKVTETMKVLLRSHGMSLTGVKSNLYTEIGLDSKHPSHIQSTVWKNTDLMKDAQMKELKDAFFEELKGGSKDPAGQDGDTKRSTKLKQVKDDPFGSDDDAEEEEKEKMPEVKKITAKPKQVKDDPFGSEEDEAKEGKKGFTPAKRKGKTETQKDDAEPPAKKKRA